MRFPLKFHSIFSGLEKQILEDRSRADCLTFFNFKWVEARQKYLWVTSSSSLNQVRRNQCYKKQICFCNIGRNRPVKGHLWYYHVTVPMKSSHEVWSLFKVATCTSPPQIPVLPTLDSFDSTFIKNKFNFSNKKVQKRHIKTKNNTQIYQKSNF